MKTIILKITYSKIPTLSSKRWLIKSADHYAYFLRHRENDQPAVIWDDGRKEWWIENNFIKSSHNEN